jgi:hypothetical protein
VSETPLLRFEALTPLLRQALAAEGRFRWQLRGRSMTPTLPPACQIEVIPLPEPAPLGALVVFAAGDRLIAHRLVRRAGGRWVTQGDGCLAADAPLTPKQILGVVQAAYQDGRRCWPGRGARCLAWFWIARHHALRPVRWAWRAARRWVGRS